jgi:hypothetical protein
MHSTIDEAYLHFRGWDIGSIGPGNVTCQLWTALSWDSGHFAVGREGRRIHWTSDIEILVEYTTAMELSSTFMGNQCLWIPWVSLPHIFPATSY